MPGNGVLPDNAAEKVGSITVFEALEPGVDHFLEAMQLGPPEIAHFVEAPIDVIKPPVDLTKAGVHVNPQCADASIGIAN